MENVLPRADLLPEKALWSFDKNESFLGMDDLGLLIDPFNVDLLMYNFLNLMNVLKLKVATFLIVAKFQKGSQNLNWENILTDVLKYAHIKGLRHILHLKGRTISWGSWDFYNQLFLKILRTPVLSCFFRIV